MKFILSFVLLIMSQVALASNNTPADYEKTFSTGSTFSKAKMAESLAWAGLSDNEFFDAIEKDVLAGYQAASTRESVNYIAWLVKALSFSGNDNYVPTIKKVAAGGGHKKLKKYASQALVALPKYTQWNKAIYPDHASAYPSRTQRYLNMLNSGDDYLVVIAAKRIHYTNTYDVTLMDALSKGVESRYKGANSRAEIDTVAHMTKALAGSTLEKYKPLVETVATEASAAKLRKYAKGYLKRYMMVAG